MDSAMFLSDGDDCESEHECMMGWEVLQNRQLFNSETHSYSFGL